MGALGARTAVHTGEPVPIFRVAWKRLVDLARALLEDPAVRPHVRLRRAPSVIQGARTVMWLGPEQPSNQQGATLVEKRTDLCPLIAILL